MSAQWRNFGAQGAWITENELSETVWDFTFRLMASFQKVDFFFRLKRYVHRGHRILD